VAGAGRGVAPAADFAALMKVCVSGDDQHAWGPSAGNRADPRGARQHAGAHEPRMDLIKKLGEHSLCASRVGSLWVVAWWLSK
jgi:hypothetical protein